MLLVFYIHKPLVWTTFFFSWLTFSCYQKLPFKKQSLTKFMDLTLGILTKRSLDNLKLWGFYSNFLADVCLFGWLVWNRILLNSPGWPWTCYSPPAASASPVQESHLCTTMPCLPMFSLNFIVFLSTALMDQSLSLVYTRGSCCVDKSSTINLHSQPWFYVWVHSIWCRICIEITIFAWTYPIVLY